MLGELFSAGASLVGGLFGKSSAEKANRQNIQLQKDFAKNGIQWKVADAKKAGIHPLAALGAQTVSFTPSVVGDSSFGTGIAQAGQDIGRAINSTRSPDQRIGAVQKSILDLELQGKQLDNRGKEIENALLASKLHTTSQVGPAMPEASQRYLVDGQGQAALPQGSSRLLSPQPLEFTVSAPGMPASEPGPITSLGWGRTAAGGLQPLPSSDYKQRIEDDIFLEAQQAVRNQLMPNLGLGAAPPFRASPGMRWSWSYRDQSWHQVPNPNRGRQSGGGGW